MELTKQERAKVREALTALLVLTKTTDIIDRYDQEAERKGFEPSYISAAIDDLRELLGEFKP